MKKILIGLILLALSLQTSLHAMEKTTFNTLPLKPAVALNILLSADRKYIVPETKEKEYQAVTYRQTFGEGQSSELKLHTQMVPSELPWLLPSSYLQNLKEGDLLEVVIDNQHYRLIAKQKDPLKNKAMKSFEEVFNELSSSKDCITIKNLIDVNGLKNIDKVEFLQRGNQDTIHPQKTTNKLEHEKVKIPPLLFLNKPEITIEPISTKKEVLDNNIFIIIEDRTLYRAGDFKDNMNLKKWITSSEITEDTLLVKVAAPPSLESAPKYYPVDAILGYAANCFSNDKKDHSIECISNRTNSSLGIGLATLVNKENSSESMTLEEFAEFLKNEKEKKGVRPTLDNEGNLKEETLPEVVGEVSEKRSISIGSYSSDTSNTNFGLYAKLGIFAGIGLALYLKPSLLFEPLNYLFGRWWQYKIEN